MCIYNSIFLIAFEIFGSLFFFTRKKGIEIKDETYIHKKGLLCRFVIDGTGKKIGESISLDEDIIVIKSGNKFLGVPLKHVEDTEKNLLVKGLIDFDKAYKIGEKWRQKSFSEIEQINESKDNKGKPDGY